MLPKTLHISRFLCHIFVAQHKLGSIMDDISISRNIRLYREQSGKTQTEMAEILGIDRCTYNSLECGKTNIIKDIVYRIAEILDIPVEKLILGEQYAVFSRNTLDENVNLKEQYDTLKKYSEEKIAEVIKENELLRQVNEAQAETIKRNGDIINMLLREK